MSHPHIEVAYDAVMQTGECPLWHPQEQALYWVDIPACTVHRLDPASGAHRAWKLASEPATLAISDRGGLVVAMRSGFAHLDTSSEEVRLTGIVAAPYDTAITRFNDGRVDPAGRFWVGTMYEPRDQPKAEMYVLDKGKLRLAWSGGMTNSNGLSFSPDGKTMYHSDTTSHRVDAYDYDVKTGTASNRRNLVTFGDDKKAADYGGRPDGAAVDSEGNYWSAMFEGGRIVKLSPTGELLQEIELPVRCPTSVAFGGPDLRTLFVTSASKGRSNDELAQYPHSGKVLAFTVDVPGIEQAEYRG